MAPGSTLVTMGYDYGRGLWLGLTGNPAVETRCSYILNTVLWITWVSGPGAIV